MANFLVVLIQYSKNRDSLVSLYNTVRIKNLRHKYDKMLFNISICIEFYGYMFNFDLSIPSMCMLLFQK